MTRSKIMKKLWQNPEYRKYMSKCHKGHSISDETKKKISIAKKGQHNSPNTEFKKGTHPNPNTEFKKGSNHPLWKGGRRKTVWDYIVILKPNHPFCDSTGYIREHRLIMEKHLNRFLNPEEIVHHINGIKDDNRIENLMLFKNETEHAKFHNPKGKKIAMNRR